ncbi:MAG: hypothetical protein OEM22_04245, partial [Acidimicrobiia bacterium]|nr:hypothetical protein [Acidimicrobiia bacterium]
MKLRIFLVTVIAVLAVAAPASALISATVQSGTSADVFLTIDFGTQPTVTASGTDPLSVSFSPVVGGPGANQWSSTMTIGAVGVPPGTYDFDIAVSTSSGAQLVERVIVTVTAP